MINELMTTYVVINSIRERNKMVNSPQDYLDNKIVSASTKIILNKMNRVIASGKYVYCVDRFLFYCREYLEVNVFFEYDDYLKHSAELKKIVKSRGWRDIVILRNPPYDIPPVCCNRTYAYVIRLYLPPKESNQIKPISLEKNTNYSFPLFEETNLPKNK